MRTLFLAALLLAGAALFPASSHAQRSCTYSCACSQISCGCGEGGRGSSCDTDGYVCKVIKCTTQVARVDFSLDGRVVDLSRALGEAPADAAETHPGEAPTLPPSAWEYVSPGYSVARACGGIVIARSWVPDAAAEVRARSREISI